MERFKKSLKIALSEKVDGLRLEVESPPSLLRITSEKEIEGLRPYRQEELEALIHTLLPHIDQVDDSMPVQGELSIVNFGNLKLVGKLGLRPQLYVFIPPQGNQLFRQVWNQLTNSPGGGNIDRPNLSESQTDDLAGTFSMTDADTGEHKGNENWLNSKHSEESDKSHFSPILFSPGQKDEQKAKHQQSDMINTDPMDLPIQHAPRASHFPEVNHDEPDLDEDFNQSEEAQGLTSHMQGNEGFEIPDAGLASIQNELNKSSVSALNFMKPQTTHDLNEQANPSWTPPIQKANLDNAPAPQSPAEIFFGPVIPGESLDPSIENRKIDELLKEMIKNGASDLHLTLGQPVSLRIDGDIQRINTHDIVTEDLMKTYLLPIMPSKNQHEFLATNDTDFAYQVRGLARFRVNVFRDIHGVGAVLRQIPDRIPDAEELGLPSVIKKLCKLSKGLVLVTGPTGSGKSTTLAAMVDLINKTRKEHLLTIEDPIEFVHPQKLCLVHQREVHRHTTSFSKALRAALREDPDIILIGEMRDLETIAIAIETAETGHLVFGTLHTTTAISTIDRLIDQFPADQQEQIRIMLSESLKGVVAQTLIKRKNGGRAAAQEILVVDRAVSSLIRESNTHMIQNHMQTQKAKGNILLNDALLNLVTSGVVDPSDAYAKAVDKEGFLKLLQQKGFGNDISQAS